MKTSLYKLVSSKNVYSLDTFLVGFFLKPKLNNLLCDAIETRLWHVCSPVNMLHIFRTPFNKNTYRGLLLSLTYAISEFLTWHQRDLNPQPVRKRTLNHLAKFAKWMSCVVSTDLYGAFDCMLLSGHVRVLDWIYTLELPEYQGTLCSKQEHNLKFKWQQQDSNPQLFSS